MMVTPSEALSGALLGQTTWLTIAWASSSSYRRTKWPYARTCPHFSPFLSCGERPHSRISLLQLTSKWWKWQVKEPKPSQLRQGSKTWESSVFLRFSLRAIQTWTTPSAKLPNHRQQPNSNSWKVVVWGIGRCMSRLKCCRNQAGWRVWSRIHSQIRIFTRIIPSSIVWRSILIWAFNTTWNNQ